MDDNLVAAHVDAIYGVPREDFTAERARRVKSLRADGHREEAAALQAHRKPTVAAWAVNQLARRHRPEVGELIAAGEELRDAQRRAASRRGGAGLREATRRLRGLVTGLRTQARVLLEGAGSRADPHLDEVEHTLFAAAVDPAQHDTLRRGVFAAPVQAAGFGSVEGLVLVAPSATEDTDEAAADDGAAEREREAARQRAAHRRELEQRRSQLQRSRIRQQQRLERAEAKVEELRAELREFDDQIEAVLRELEAVEPQ